MNYFIETLLGVFTIDKGEIRVLLMKRKTDPYKGYWCLPGDLLKEETLDDNIKMITNNLGIPSLYLKQTKSYTGIEFERFNSLAVSYIGLIDSITYLLKREEKEDIELEWFDVNLLPKTAFSHEIIINDLYNYFKKQIVNSNILRILFPSDFTLPELQRIYEQVLNKELDRRNFRKKLMNLGYIVDTGDINEGYTGRPAKLYRFKDEIEEKNLF